MAESIKTKDQNHDSANESPVTGHRRPALSGWPMIIGWVAMLIFALQASTHMVGAGDTWVAMACGRHFINHGVDTVEPFSANSHKAGPTEEDIQKWPKAARWIADKVGLETVRYWHPTGWVNQNWLTHVIFYWLTTLSPFADAEDYSFNTLVYWKFAVYILTVICVYYTGRILGANAALSAVFACFALFVGRTFLDIRPAGFSNLLVAVFLLVLVLTTYRNILYIWLIVPLSVFWCNLHGGYIYVFIMLMPFFAFNLLTITSKKRFVTIGTKGLYHTAAAGFAAFIGCIVFNPFHLTNLTHTFVISVSKHAEMWRNVNEWHPAFEWSNPVGSAIPFLIMYIICWLVFIVWAVVLIAQRRAVRLKTGRRKRETMEGFEWPRIDLAMMVIAALTIYMAIRSRRFIPIAGYAACPVLAVLVDQTIRVIAAVGNFRKTGVLKVNPMPVKFQRVFVIGGIAAVLFFGTWWGLKFKRVYLDAWPTDPNLTSVFIRMTASDAKPFDAGKFIKGNKLSGKMFNYWTEGGFIAWSQEPDPNTGKTPLQLFMDGRAQAAYEPNSYQLWAGIMSGGPVYQSAVTRGQRLSRQHYTKIGEWMDQELKKHNVWVVLMPAKEFDKPSMAGLEHSPSWHLIFLNNKQRLFVDITTPQGKALFDGLFNGKTVYPDEFSRNLALAHNAYLFGTDPAAKERALDFAIRAFELQPCQAPMVKITGLGAKMPASKSRVDQFCKSYFDDFDKNRKIYARQHAYHNRLVAALIAGDYLRQQAQRQKDTKLADFYAAKRVELENERRHLLNDKRW